MFGTKKINGGLALIIRYLYMIDIDLNELLEYSRLFKKAVEIEPKTLRSIDIKSRDAEEAIPDTQKNVWEPEPKITDADELSSQTDYVVMLNIAKQSVLRAIKLLDRIPDRMDQFDPMINIDFSEILYLLNRAQVSYNRALNQ